MKRSNYPVLGDFWPLLAIAFASMAILAHIAFTDKEKQDPMIEGKYYLKKIVVLANANDRTEIPFSQGKMRITPSQYEKNIVLESGIVFNIKTQYLLHGHLSEKKDLSKLGFGKGERLVTPMTLHTGDPVLIIAGESPSTLITVEWADEDETVFLIQTWEKEGV